MVAIIIVKQNRFLPFFSFHAISTKLLYVASRRTSLASVHRYEAFLELSKLIIQRGCDKLLNRMSQPPPSSKALHLNYLNDLIKLLFNTAQPHPSAHIRVVVLIKKFVIRSYGRRWRNNYVVYRNSSIYKKCDLPSSLAILFRRLPFKVAS